ncbi:MAG: hypothetical protein HQL19_08695 [Candidatus Omnitrophica bacterium]|nr:hypothetical protein [Candidatus Omnitrophota bacterium]
MLALIRPRGPDDEGACLIARQDANFKLFATEHSNPLVQEALPRLAADASFGHDAVFVHTRFAVIDPSSKGHQPYVSADGNVVGVFNGEIYNYVELREALKKEGGVFQTFSDTEVLVEGYRIWGQALWPRMNGFWAVALYDRRDQKIVLCRDRLGVAPLYWRETEEGVFFSSLIGPLLSVGGRRTGVKSIRNVMPTAMTCAVSLTTALAKETMNARPRVNRMIGMTHRKNSSTFGKEGMK